jgi:fermentation-respiration switch protein FrsA (DUF1100 family)
MNSIGLRPALMPGFTGPVRRFWHFIAKYRVGAIALAVAAAAYLSLCLWFYLHQREFQYRPFGIVTTPEAVGLSGFARVTITTDDGERLDAWWLPPPPQRGTVLFLHGTPGSLADTIWRLPDLQQSGFGVLAIDYRGYGASTGTPSEAGFAADARAASDFIRNAAPETRIAVFGESLGTGIAVTLARERPVAGLLLNAPYASVRRLFELRAPPLPYRWLMKDPFDSESKIGEIGVPVMILHGTADQNIPIEEARRLFAAAHQPKTIIEIEGVGHLAAWEGGGAASALAALAAWTTPR